MVNDFLEVALPGFRCLTESGHYQLTHQHLSSAFDHGVLLFESPIIHILFGREDDSLFLDIACASEPTEDHWYDFPLIRHLLDHVPDDQLDDSESLAASLPFASADSAATELRQYLSRAEEAFSTHRLHDTEASLDAIKSIENRRLFATSIAKFVTEINNTATHALRARLRVTEPPSTAAFPSTMQVPRRSGVSLSLGSGGVRASR